MHKTTIMDNEELELIQMFDNIKFNSENEESTDENDIDMILEYDQKSPNNTETSANLHFNYENSVECLFKNSDLSLHKKFNELISAIFKIIIKDSTFTSEIVDNVIIINNVLYFLNPQCKNGEISFGSILRLTEFHKQKIPRRGDPKWWGGKCSNFEDLIQHLSNSSTDSIKSFNNQEVLLIENNIIDLACNLVRRDFEFKPITIDTDIQVIYDIANYLENYFINNIGSFHTDEIQYTSKYFLEFKTDILYKLASHDNKNFTYFRDLYTDQINLALFKVLRGAQNMLILFGPFGYDALKDNYEFIDLKWDDIYEFKKEGLRYIALNNLIELKINKKKNHIRHQNDYASFIFKGASLII